MSIEYCKQCSRCVDTDQDVESIQDLHGVPICVDCLYKWWVKGLVEYCDEDQVYYDPDVDPR